MRDSGLVEGKSVGEITNACLLIDACQGRYDCEPIGISHRLEQLGLGSEIASKDRGRWTAALNSHGLMLSAESNIVNIRFGGTHR